jgi:hypothetical protein
MKNQELANKIAESKIGGVQLVGVKKELILNIKKENLLPEKE